MTFLPAFKRYSVLALCGFGAVAMLALLAAGWRWPLLPAVLLGLLALLGIRDLIQKRHAVLRNYPIIGHMRFLLEDIRPEIRQYLIESDSDELPFSREARQRIRIGAAGKIVSAFDIARALALGADWCNSARGFMFAIGCIQSQSCHTNACPVGIATQDKLRQRGLEVGTKALHVARFHKNTLHALAEIAGAAGLSSPSDFLPYHFMFRHKDGTFSDGNEAFPYLPQGFLVADRETEELRDWHKRWGRASAETFAPSVIPEGRFV